MSKRPKDMTHAELNALPVGRIVLRRREWTREERLAGAMGRWKEWAEMPETRVVEWQPDDLVMWRAPDGSSYTFGQRADGSWFKEAVRL